MDSEMKHMRVRFSGVGQEEHGGNQTMTIPPQTSTSFERGQMSTGEEYDATYAAAVAAAVYAIAERKEKLASQKKPAAMDEPAIPPSTMSPIKRGESMKKPTEGSKISRSFSGKEPSEEEDDGPGANVSIRRPLTPAQKKPEDTAPDHKVLEKVVSSTPGIKKDPSFSKKSPEKKGSKKFEQEQASQKAPPTVRPATSYSARGSGAGAAGVAISGDAETMADAWEKAKLAKIKQHYDETMDTIAEWENGKKEKAKRQKELKESDLDRRRAKAFQEYNEEISRISKVARESRSVAEEKKRNAENKIREKANKIRSTGKLPQSCACF